MKVCLRILVGAVLLAEAGCRSSVEKTGTVPVVRIATVSGRVMNPFSEALARGLSDHFPARIQVEKAKTSETYLKDIGTGQIDFAMVQTDVAYLAYTKGAGGSGGPQRNLRGVAVLYTSPVRLLATQASGIRNIADLRGKRVFVGTGHNPSEFTVRMALEGVGLSLADIRPQWLPNDAIVPELREGKLDAVFARGNDPAPAVKEMMKVPGVLFIPIPDGQIEKIYERDPFIHSTSIPAGMYGRHPEIETAGVDMLLTCHDDLPEDLVYWVTRILFESLPALAGSLNSIRQIDVEHIQASPIPLHPGAARFYRERELFP